MSRVALDQALTAGMPGRVAEQCVQVQAMYPVDTNSVLQPESNFLELYAAAKKYAGAFQQQVEDFGALVGFPAQSRPGNVKSLDRIVEKYQGTDRVLPLDMLAGKVVVPNLHGLYRVAARVGEAFEVVAYRDRVLRPQKSGYRDLHFIVGQQILVAGHDEVCCGADQHGENRYVVRVAQPGCTGLGEAVCI
uniref:hypothetical protein n=1 Tax=Deinococcus sp. TaxID=47478 RepID=UPI00286D6E75